MADCTSVVTTLEALPPVEADRLQKCEAVIEAGLATFVDVGQALLEIQRDQLYRFAHRTFEDYLKSRWQMSRARGYQLLEAAEVMTGLSTTVDTPPPTSERQARELAKVEPEDQATVWKEAARQAPDGQPTAAAIAKTIERLSTPTCPNCGSTETDDDGDCAQCKEPAVFKPKVTTKKKSKARCKKKASTPGEKKLSPSKQREADERAARKEVERVQTLCNSIDSAASNLGGLLSTCAGLLYPHATNAYFCWNWSTVDKPIKGDDDVPGKTLAALREYLPSRIADDLLKLLEGISEESYRELSEFFQ